MSKYEKRTPKQLGPLLFPFSSPFFYMHSAANLFSNQVHGSHFVCAWYLMFRNVEFWSKFFLEFWKFSVFSGLSFDDFVIKKACFLSPILTNSNYSLSFDTKMKSAHMYSTNLNEIEDDMFDTEAFCRNHKPVRMEDIQEHRIAVG